MIFDELRLIDDPFPGDGAWNMAVDEMLTEGIEMPTLRAYRWSEPAVTVGYFEKITHARNLRPGLPMMRRWTGGGLVDHGADWTYSLILPATHFWANEGRRNSYFAIHEVLRDFAKEQYGIALELAGEDRADGDGCFARPVNGDLLLDGRKIAGAAQRRTRRFLLHQGSVQHLPICGNDASLIAARLAGKVSPSLLSELEKIRATELVATRYGLEEWLNRF